MFDLITGIENIYGCSKSEVVRTALIYFLKNRISKIKKDYTRKYKKRI
jgi:hypothetical protein